MMSGEEKIGLSVGDVIRIWVCRILMTLAIGFVGAIILRITQCIMGRESVATHAQFMGYMKWGISLVCDIAVLVWLIHYVKKAYLKPFELSIKGKANGYAIIMVSMVILGYCLAYSNSIGILVHKVPNPWWIEKIIAFVEKEWTAYPIRAFVDIVIIAPICEEILYRGIFLEGLLRRYTTKKAILVSALVFGIIHFNLTQSVNAFIIGIILGIIYYQTKSLLLCMLVHFINNLISFIPIGLFQNTSLGGFVSGMVILGIAVLYYRQYKEKFNFREPRLN
ncbi:MAG: lysostaphin resistance A-like protein [Cellulosilyticaceae bacterium]